jgi:uncharacterized protein
MEVIMAREIIKIKMTLQQAGHRGGEARAEKYGPVELSEQAKRGAKTIERIHPGFHSEIGKKGGKRGGNARAQKYSREELSAQARKGAKTIERTHPGFHSEIGHKGGEARGKHREDEG